MLRSQTTDQTEKVSDSSDILYKNGELSLQIFFKSIKNVEFSL